MDDAHFKLNPRIIERIKYERLHAHARRLLNTLEIQGYPSNSVRVLRLKHIMRACEAKLKQLQ